MPLIVDPRVLQIVSFYDLFMTIKHVNAKLILWYLFETNINHSFIHMFCKQTVFIIGNRDLFYRNYQTTFLVDHEDNGCRGAAEGN